MNGELLFAGREQFGNLLKDNCNISEGYWIYSVRAAV